MILDLIPYSNLGFGKTINEMVSLHTVTTWLDLINFRKTGPRSVVPLNQRYTAYLQGLEHAHRPSPTQLVPAQVDLLYVFILRWWKKESHSCNPISCVFTDKQKTQTKKMIHKYYILKDSIFLNWFIIENWE